VPLPEPKPAVAKSTPKAKKVKSRQRGNWRREVNRLLSAPRKIFAD
jgi:hypothetical protein